MKKEVKLLLEKAIDSLVLSAEHFNRPHDRGRVTAVLILLDHSYEMLLKAAIVHRGGKIREPRAKETIGFDHCVRKCFSEGKIKFLSEEQCFTLRTINSLRDAAQHYLVDVSEQHLYIQAQAGLTLFRDILDEVFKKELLIELPVRVLPLSTSPPTDLEKLFDNEIKEIKRLLSPGKRRGAEAAAKLRALALVEGATHGSNMQPSQQDLKRIGAAIQEGKHWNDLFPGVATIKITSSGHGPSLELRITKKDGVPVCLVPEGSPEAAVVAVKRVNELGYYNLGRDQLAKKVGLTGPKTTAMIWYLDLQSDPECYKEIRIGGSRFHRYSQKAIAKIKKELAKVTVDSIWQEYRSR